jgi:hypothetical protein
MIDSSLPPALAGPTVWYGPQVARSAAWLETFSPTELAEIEGATAPLATPRSAHNHTLLHDRTAFDDWPEPGRKRHLLRLWLAPDDARPLPPVFAERYGSVIPGARGGVAVSHMMLNAPLAAE